MQLRSFLGISCSSATACTIEAENLFQELRLLDLDNEDNCIWSFNSQAEHRKFKSDPTINYFETEVFYDFDVQQDGSIAVVFGMDTFISDTPVTESEQRR